MDLSLRDAGRATGAVPRQEGVDRLAQIRSGLDDVRRSCDRVLVGNLSRVKKCG